jgi:glycosyl hydrolase family 2
MLAATLTALLAALLPTPAPAGGAPPMARDGPAGRVALATGWHFAADPGGTGAAAGWSSGAFKGRPVSVPHSANPQSLGRPQAGIAFRGSEGWYRRDVRVGGGTYAMAFSSAAFQADVYLDGRQVGTHRGAYAPFTVRARLGAGLHRLVVHVDWRSPARQSAAGFHRTWFNYGGLNGEVTLRRVHASEVQGVIVRTHLRRDGAAHLTILARVINHGPRRRLGVLGRLGRDRFFSLPARAVPAGGSAGLRTTITVPRPRLWSPGHGALYRLQLGVPLEGGYVARIGLRELRFSDGVLRVNGRRTLLRGASVQEDVPGHGDALTAEDMDRVVARLRAAGANATRALHPLAPALVERLDAAGIALWQEIGPVDSPGDFTTASPALQALATRRVRADLAANRLHPAIVGWSLGCEVAGNGTGPQGAWVDANAQALHAADAGRPVGVDVWNDHLPAVPGRLYAHLDAIGTTSYLGWYEDTHASPASVARDLRARLAAFRARFPGRLLLLAEFGAEGTPATLNAPAAHGGRGYQARLIALHLRALRRVGYLDGAFVWSLQDFAINPAFRGGTIARQVPGIGLTSGLNQKGLFDRDGRAKPALRAARDGFAALGAP